MSLTFGKEMKLFELKINENEIILKSPEVKGAYARIDLKFIWNKGTKHEKVIPTLDYVFVPTRLRGRGLGKKLIQMVLEEMKTRHLKYLAFDNFDSDFWDSIERNFPKSVIWTSTRGSFAKRTGALLLDKSVKIDEVFNWGIT